MMIIFSFAALLLYLHMADSRILATKSEEGLFFARIEEMREGQFKVLKPSWKSWETTFTNFLNLTLVMARDCYNYGYW